MFKEDKDIVVNSGLESIWAAKEQIGICYVLKFEEKKNLLGLKRFENICI